MPARKAILTNGLYTLLIDMLTNEINKLHSDGLPKWVSSAFTTVDALMQLPFKAYEDTKSEKTEKPAPELNLQPLLPVDQQHILLKLCLGFLNLSLKQDVAHAVLLVVSRLTRSQEIASIFTLQGGIDPLLKLPAASVPMITIILRHLIEDPAALQAAMETEITTIMGSIARPGSRTQPKQFLSSLAGVVCRDPPIFMQAAAATCRIIPGSTNIVLASVSTDKNANKNNAPSTPATTTAPSTTTTTATSTTTTTAPDTPKKKRSANLKQVVTQLINFLLETVCRSLLF